MRTVDEEMHEHAEDDGCAASIPAKFVDELRVLLLGEAGLECLYVCLSDVFQLVASGMVPCILFDNRICIRLCPLQRIPNHGRVKERIILYLYLILSNNLFYLPFNLLSLLNLDLAG